MRVNGFGAEAAETLVRILEEENEDLVRRCVARAWPRLSPAVQTRLRRWAPGSLQSQQVYAEAWLAKLETGAEKVFPRLFALAVKGRCSPRTLALVGRQHADAPAAFEQMLKDSPGVARSDVALAGAMLGMRGVSVLPALQSYLGQAPVATPGAFILGAPIKAVTNRVEPELVILAIGALGPGANNAVPALVNCLENASLAPGAVWALTEIGPGAAEAVPKLSKMLRRASPDEELRIVKCLHAIGAGAAAARLDLYRLRTSETNLLQLLVSLTLAEIEGEPEMAKRAIVKSLKGRKHLSRVILRTGFPQFPSRGEYQGLNHAEYAALVAAEVEYDPELLEHLEQALDGTGGWRLQILAARAIWRLTGRSDVAVLAAWNGLFSDDPFCVKKAIELLEEIPVGAQETPLMKEFLRDWRRAWPHRMRVMRVVERVESGER